MIPHHNHSNILKNPSFLQTLNQPSNHPINSNNCLGNLGIVRPNEMALMIWVFKIQCHKDRNIVIRQIKVTKNRVNTILKRYRPIIIPTITNWATPRTFNYLRTRPEIGRSLQSMVDHSLPQGFTEPPLRFMA
uniref:Uncharacterized protein n=1 Tax=Opuntia streptacantha TaxID=393608 RepID=A0A7C9D8A4_OPUST